MPYKFKPGGYPIPEVIEVGGRRCIQFEVPDDPRYIAAATGAITSLGNWWVWEKTKPGDRRATETAAFLRGILADTLKVLEECGEEGEPMPVYTIEADGCTIVLKADGVTVSSVDLTDPELIACLPEGPPGPQGPQGPQGPPGEQGPSGETTNNNPPPSVPPSDPEQDERLCGIATYITDWLKELNDFYITQLEQQTAILDIVSQVAALTIVGDIAVDNIVGLGNAIMNFGILSYQAAINPFFLEDYQCAMYCELEKAGGQWSMGIFGATADRVRQEQGFNLAHEIFFTVPATFSEGEWNARARIGAEMPTPECDVCDCPEDFCAPQKMHWVDIGATPTGWTSVSALPSGITNPHGFSSELMLNLYGVPSQGTRSANTDWTVTRQAVVALAVKYEFPEPCDVIDLYVAATQGGLGNNTKYIYIVVELPDGEHRLIKAAKANVGSLPTISLKWEGDPLTVKAVYYMMRTGGGTLNHTITMHDNEINEGLL